MENTDLWNELENLKKLLLIVYFSLIIIFIFTGIILVKIYNKIDKKDKVTLDKIKMRLNIKD